MGATRRTFVLCAVAGLVAASGWSASRTVLPNYVFPPLARSQAPSRTAHASPDKSDARSVANFAAPPAVLQAGRGPLPNSTPPTEPADTPLPINLATALQLSNARTLDVQI